MKMGPGRSLQAPCFGVLGGTWALLRGRINRNKRPACYLASPSGGLKLALAVCPMRTANADGPGSDAKASGRPPQATSSMARNPSSSTRAAANMLVVAAEINGRPGMVSGRRQTGTGVQIEDPRLAADITRQVCTVHFRDAAAERLGRRRCYDLAVGCADRILLVLAAESAAGLQQNPCRARSTTPRNGFAFGKTDRRIPVHQTCPCRHVRSERVLQNTAVLFAALGIERR